MLGIVIHNSQPPVMQAQQFVAALLDERVLAAVRTTANEQGLGEELRQFRLVYGGRRESDAISLDSVPDLVESPRPVEQEPLHHLNLTGESPAPEFAPGQRQVHPVFLAPSEDGGPPTIVPFGSAEYARRREEMRLLRDGLLAARDAAEEFVPSVGQCVDCGTAPLGHALCPCRQTPRSPSYEPFSPCYSPARGDRESPEPVDNSADYEPPSPRASPAWTDNEPADPAVPVGAHPESDSLPDVGVDIPDAVLQFFRDPSHAVVRSAFDFLVSQTFGAAYDQAADAGLAADEILRQQPLSFDDCSWYLRLKEYLVFKLLAYVFLCRRFFEVSPLPAWPTYESGFLTREEANTMCDDIRTLERLGNELLVFRFLQDPFRPVMDELATRRDMLRALTDAGMIWDTPNNAPVARLLRSVDGLLAADPQVCAHHVQVFVEQANQFELEFGHVSNL